MYIAIIKHCAKGPLSWGRRSCIIISPLCLSCVNRNRSAECSVADFAQKWVVQQERAGTHTVSQTLFLLLPQWFFFSHPRRSIAHRGARARSRVGEPSAAARGPIRSEIIKRHLATNYHRTRHVTGQEGDELHVDVCAKVNGSFLLRAGGRLTWRVRRRQPRAMILIGNVWHGKNTISHAF